MKKTAIALTMILAALALAACGDSDDGDGGATATIGTEETETEAPEEVEGGEDEAAGGGSTVAIEAAPDGALAYTSDEASAEAGEVTVDFTNESSVAHDVDVEDAAGETILDTAVITESSESASAEMEPSEFTFYCSVPGHREAGMEGTLTVE